MIRVRPECIRVPLPAVRQRDDYDCGPAVLQSILAYYGVVYEYESLAKRLKVCKRQGTATKAIVRVARSAGLRVAVRERFTLDLLRQSLDRCRPVVVAMSAYGDGHWAAAVGYDRQRIYLQDPIRGEHLAYLNVEEFMTRWTDRDTDGTVLERLGITIWKPNPPYMRVALPVE